MNSRISILRNHEKRKKRNHEKREKREKKGNHERREKREKKGNHEKREKREKVPALSRFSWLKPEFIYCFR